MGTEFISQKPKNRIKIWTIDKACVGDHIAAVTLPIAGFTKRHGRACWGWLLA